MRIINKFLGTMLALVALVGLAMGVLEVPAQPVVMNRSSRRAARRRGAEASVSLAKRRRWFADGPLVKEGWADALEPGIREWFFLGADRRASLIADLFDVQGSMKDSEHFRAVGAISPAAWNDFSKSGEVPSVSFDAGYKKSFQHTTYMVELPIQVELIEDNQYTAILDAADALGDSATLKREVDAASVFNNAFSASYLGADGVALCSDSHPNGPDNAGVTQDNSFALTLTKSNVKTVREAMQAFTDDKGNLVAVTPNTLIVPPGLEDDALVIAQSMQDPESANNAINPQQGRWQVKVWHYLTDSNAWFMADSVLMKRNLKWFNRVPLNVELDRVEKKAFAVYIARMRYSYGWRDWRWVAGSNPS